MTMNSTGQISLAGTVAGESIEKEIGGTGTTEISLNDANVRTLAGVASGAIVMPTNFYGKSFNTNPTTGIYFGGSVGATIYNLVTRLNACGALIGSQTNAGTARNGSGGAPIGSNGVYIGGSITGNAYSNTVTRINKCGAQVGSETATTCTAQTRAGAPAGNFGIYSGGAALCNRNSQPPYPQSLIKVNGCGSQVAAGASAGTYNSLEFNNAGQSGAKATTNAVFYGGYYCCCCTNFGSQQISVVNACMAVVAQSSTRCFPKVFGAGAKVGSNALFYAGSCYPNAANRKNTVQRVNNCGAKVGSQTNVGTARYLLGGASIGTIGVFYAGYATTNLATVTKINACAAIVGTESTVGTVRSGVAGAGVA